MSDEQDTVGLPSEGEVVLSLVLSLFWYWRRSKKNTIRGDILNFNLVDTKIRSVEERKILESIISGFINCDDVFLPIKLIFIQFLNHVNLKLKK